MSVLVLPLICELSLVDLTGTTSRDNTDEVFYNNDSNRDCVGYILSSRFSNFLGTVLNKLSFPREGYNDHDQDAMMMIRIILRVNMNDAVEGPCLRN